MRLRGFSPKFTFRRRGSGYRTSIGLTARLRSWILIVIAMSVLSGCGLFEERAASKQEPPPPADIEPEPEAVPEANLSTAMKYLETGRAVEAREILERLSREAPNSEVVSSLVRQIDVPVKELLPGPYQQIEVRPGESLSLIAAREIGDPLMFYALARLNGIDVPARVPVGTMLRIPRSMRTGQAEGEVVDQPSGIPAPEVASVAEYLARSGQVEQARQMLIGNLADGGVPDSTQDLLVRLTLERASELRAAGEFELATSVINEAIEVIDLTEPRSRLLLARSATQSSMFHRAAQDLREQGELVPAYRMAVKAAELDISSGNAARLADDLRTELVDSLHNQAMVAWRDRNVDLAIRTWESLLEVVPDFEPATVYLERARRLRERLDQP